MSDARSRYERWTKEQLLEHAVATHRGRNEDQLHRRALQQKNEKLVQLQAHKIVQLDNVLRREGESDDVKPMSELINIIWSTIDAGDPQSSPPIENTIRVTHPDSSRDEGAATRRFRKLIGSVRYHVDKATEAITNNLEHEPELSAVRREAAFYRHHKDGKHDGEPREGCPDCESEAV